MENLKISENILVKLQESHNVTRLEVEQCFSNRKGKLLVDDRALNRTTPPTLWFLSDTNKGRTLKVVYIQHGSDVTLKSAFEPNAVERRIYARVGGATY